MINCPYCGEPAKLVTGEVIYPRRKDLHSKKFWSCQPCDAYVGCHSANRYTNFEDTWPLGRLANGELRAAKMKAHAAFDPLWQAGVFKSRSRAYNWLADKLNLSTAECHIGMFDANTCRRVVEVCKDKK